MNKISGIYIITNIIENKNYIGRSSNCYSRFSKHKYLLRKNIHYNQHLQNSWNKHGESNFTFDIIDENNIKFLPSLENWWCNMLDTHNRIYGYNIELTSPFGKIKSSIETNNKIKISNTGHICLDETKEKLRVYNTGKKLSEEIIEKLKNNKRNQSIDVYNKFGEKIHTFKSIREGSRYFNIYVKNISKCISGEFNLCHSMIFKNKDDILSNDELLKRLRDSHDNMKIKIIGYYLDGTLIGKFDSFYQAEKILGIDSYKISLCCSGKQKRTKNTTWIYDNEE